jgi:hypothetical protein
MKYNLILLAMTIVIFNVTEWIYSGGFISSKTEQKYLRNLHRYEVHDYGISLKYDFLQPDTLSWFTKQPFCYIDPISKWKIRDAGAIPRWSLLSKKLDSIDATYVKPPNKYK